MLEVRGARKREKKKKQRKEKRTFARRPPVHHITTTHCSNEKTAQVELFLPNTLIYVKVKLPHPPHGSI